MYQPKVFLCFFGSHISRKKSTACFVTGCKLVMQLGYPTCFFAFGGHPVGPMCTLSRAGNVDHLLERQSLLLAILLSN